MEEKKIIQGKMNLGEMIALLVVKYFNWLVAFLVILVLVSGGWIYIKPQYEYLQEVKTTITEEKEAELAKLQQQFFQLSGLRNVYDNLVATYQTDINKINQLLPDALGQEELMAEMEMLVERNGLLLKSLTIEEIKEAKVLVTPATEIKPEDKADSLPSGLGKARVNLEVMGVTYGGLKNFLATIESNLRLLDIINLDFSPPGETLNLEILAYFKR